MDFISFFVAVKLDYCDWFCREVIAGLFGHWQRVLVISAMVCWVFSRFMSLIPSVLASEVTVSMDRVTISRVTYQFPYWVGCIVVFWVVGLLAILPFTICFGCSWASPSFLRCIGHLVQFEGWVQSSISSVLQFIQLGLVCMHELLLSITMLVSLVHFVQACKCCDSLWSPWQMRYFVVDLQLAT